MWISTLIVYGTADMMIVPEVVKTPMVKTAAPKARPAPIWYRRKTSSVRNM